MAQRLNFTDADIVNFLTNVECLEGRFDSMGALVSCCQLVKLRTGKRLVTVSISEGNLPGSLCFAGSRL